MTVPSPTVLPPPMQVSRDTLAVRLTDTRRSLQDGRGRTQPSP